MDILGIFKSSSNKYYIFLKKHKKFVEANLKKNFISIKSEEKPFLKLNTDEKIDDSEAEKIETLIWMLKNGFNKVRGYKFIKTNLSIKQFEEIRNLVKQNIQILDKYEIINNWELDLNNCIEQEKTRQKNTTCFMCAKPGHFAIDCRELYDIDGVYIGDEKECKYCKKIIEIEKIKKHEINCKMYYSS